MSHMPLSVSLQVENSSLWGCWEVALSIEWCVTAKNNKEKPAHLNLSSLWHFALSTLLNNSAQPCRIMSYLKGDTDRIWTDMSSACPLLSPSHSLSTQTIQMTNEVSSVAAQEWRRPQMGFHRMTNVTLHLREFFCFFFQESWSFAACYFSENLLSKNKFYRLPVLSWYNTQNIGTIGQIFHHKGQKLALFVFPLLAFNSKQIVLKPHCCYDWILNRGLKMV